MNLTKYWGIATDLIGWLTDDSQKFIKIAYVLLIKVLKEAK